MTLHTLLDRFDLLMSTPESVSKLRQFILRLAVRGDLTDQKRTDTSAEVLLEQVYERKWDLYNRGEIRKPKEVDSVSGEEALYDLPSSWTWARFNNIATIVSDRVDPQNHPDKPHVSPGSVEKKSGKLLDYNTIREDGVTSSKSRFQPGQIVYSKIRPNLAKAIIAEFGGLCSADMYPIRSHIETGYLHWYMLSEPFTAQVTVDDNRVAMPKTNQSELRRVVIPLPPLKEQQRIVETVDQLMDECDTLEEQQEREHALQVQVGTAATEALRSADDAEALRPAWERVHEHFDTVTATPEGVDALRQTILQLAVQGRLTERNTEDKPASELVRKSSVEIQELYDSGKITKPSERPTVREEEKVFDLPDKWTWTRLGNVLALVNGRAYKESELLDEGTPVIRIQNLTGGGSWYYTDLDLPPEKYCNTGDLLYTWSGTFGPHIWDGGKAVFHYHIWRIELTTGLTKQFAYHLLQAISADVEEDAHGIMLPHMTKGGMEKHPVPLPPLAEQKRIVETLDRLLPLFDRLSENVCDKSKRGEQLLEAALSDVAEDSPDQMPAQVAS